MCCIQPPSTPLQQNQPLEPTQDTNTRHIIHVDCIGVLCLGFGSQISKARCRSRRTRYYRQGYPRTPKIEMFFVYCRVYSTSIFSSLTSVLYRLSDVMLLSTYIEVNVKYKRIRQGMTRRVWIAIKEGGQLWQFLTVSSTSHFLRSSATKYCCLI